MPTYVYRCDHCDKGEFEENRSMSEDVSVSYCPDCKNDCKQVIQVSKLIPENPWKKGR
jgi:putative FmdB family regulatory protein